MKIIKIIIFVVVLALAAWLICQYMIEDIDFLRR
jgi:hypothetical protein